MKKIIIISAILFSGLVSTAQIRYFNDSIRRMPGSLQIQTKVGNNWVNMPFTDSVGTGGGGITLPQLTDSLNPIRAKHLADSTAQAAIINLKLSNITGLVTAGTGATVTGSGTSGSPYVIGANGTPVKTRSPLQVNYKMGVDLSDTLLIRQSSSTDSGYLSKEDWIKFNNASIGGDTNYIQYNGGGVFAADSNFRWNKSGFLVSPKTYSGLYVSPTLTAQNNADTLVAINVSNTYNANGKVNVFFKDFKVNKIFIGIDAVNNISFGSYNSARPTLGNSNFFGNNAGVGATSAFSSNFFGPSAGYTSLNASYSNFIGAYAGNNAANASYSNFLGTNAGNNATNANNSNFFGNNAGSGATGASNSNFFSAYSGQSASSASYSNFFGVSAGNGATSASYSNFLGYQSGQSATGANNSNFFGNNAGQFASSALHSNFLGSNAGYAASGASYSNFFGRNSGYAATGAFYSNFIGAYSGDSSINSNYSIFLGNSSGSSRLTTGSPYILTGKNNIFIGNKITGATASVSNSFNIGNVLYGFNIKDEISAITGSPQSTGKVGINTGTVAASAAFEIKSTTAGLLLPRMTTAQKNAISSPDEGLIVYDLTLHKLCVYTGSAWETITSL